MRSAKASCTPYLNCLPSAKGMESCLSLLMPVGAASLACDAALALRAAAFNSLLSKWRSTTLF